jgi:hypothetical protein
MRMLISRFTRIVRVRPLQLLLGLCLALGDQITVGTSEEYLVMCVRNPIPILIAGSRS